MQTLKAFVSVVAAGLAAVALASVPLPEDYLYCDYVKSSGSQYVDTGLEAQGGLSVAQSASAVTEAPTDAPALLEEKFTHELGEKLSVASSSATAKYAVRRVDDRHLVLTCSEPASATVKMPLFSGYVRCYPRVGGRRTKELVLTKGVGDRPTFTLIMLAPCYGATEYEIETCVPYRP